MMIVLYNLWEKTRWTWYMSTQIWILSHYCHHPLFRKICELIVVFLVSSQVTYEGEAQYPPLGTAPPQGLYGAPASGPSNNNQGYIY